MKERSCITHVALVVVLATACVTVFGPIEKKVLNRAMGGYEPIKLRTIHEVPAEIMVSVQTHLRGRLGDKFLEKMEFSGGELVDFEKLYLINPGARNYKWTVPKYRLFFSYRAPELGIKEYQAEISLDEDGAVIKEIDLPNVVAEPSKGEFISFRAARIAASSERLFATDAELIYMAEMDAIAWRFHRWDGVAHQYLCVSAHTGEVLARFGSVPVH